MRAKRPSWSELPPPLSMGTERGREQPRPPRSAHAAAPPASCSRAAASSSRAASSSASASARPPPPPPPGLSSSSSAQLPPHGRARGRARRGAEPSYSAGLGGVAKPGGAPSPTSPLSLPLSAFNTTIIISDSRGGGGRARGRAGGRGAPSVLEGGEAGEEGEGRAEKKCMAEGRVETDTGSKMARRPPAPSPPAGCVCVCVCHSVYPPNDWAGKVPTAGVELTQQHNADTGALRTRAPPSGPAIPPLGLEPGLGLVTCPARRAVANAVAVGV